jgi:hypothetical protein
MSGTREHQLDVAARRPGRRDLGPDLGRGGHGDADHVEVARGREVEGVHQPGVVGSTGRVRYVRVALAERRERVEASTSRIGTDATTRDVGPTEGARGHRVGTLLACRRPVPIAATSTSETRSRMDGGPAVAPASVAAGRPHGPTAPSLRRRTRRSRAARRGRRGAGADGGLHRRPVPPPGARLRRRLGRHRDGVGPGARARATGRAGDLRPLPRRARRGDPAVRRRPRRGGRRGRAPGRRVRPGAIDLNMGCPVRKVRHRAAASNCCATRSAPPPSSPPSMPRCPCRSR